MISRRGLLFGLVGWERHPEPKCPVCLTPADEARFVLAKLDVYWCAWCGNLWGLNRRG